MSRTLSPRIARFWKKLRRRNTRCCAPQADQLAHELEQQLLVLAELPVEPGELVVLAVGVVVALLACGRARRPPSSIGTPCDSKQRREQVALLARAQRADLRVVGRPFDAAVPAAVVVLAVAVVLAVGLVVLVVVAHEVAQREAVVRGDEVDAGVRPAAAVLVQIARAGDAVGELADQAAVALPVVADRVAILAVPLGPADREVARPGSRPRRGPTARRSASPARSPGPDE